MKHFLLSRVAVVAMAILSTLRASEETKPRPTLLILPFENASGDAALSSLRHAIPDLVTVFLSDTTGDAAPVSEPDSPPLTVVDRESLERSIREIGLRWENLTREDIDEFRGVTSAQFVLTGSVRSGRLRVHDRDFVEVSATIYDTETTAVVAAFEVNGRLSSLGELCRDLARDAVEHLQVRGAEKPALPVDDDPASTTELIHGLAYYHSDRHAQAIVHFYRILENDPGDETARYWLARAFESEGVRVHAEIEFRRFLERFPTSPRRDDVERRLEDLRSPPTKDPIQRRDASRQQAGKHDEK